MIARSGRLREVTDDDLYERGIATALASWRSMRGVLPTPSYAAKGVTAAVFPSAPERAVYNNAVLDRELGGTERAAAVECDEVRIRLGRCRAIRRVGARERPGHAR